MCTPSDPNRAMLRTVLLASLSWAAIVFSLLLFAGLAKAQPACRFHAASLALECARGTYPCTEQARGDLVTSSPGEERALWCRDWTEDEVLSENPGSYLIVVDARSRVRWSSEDQYTMSLEARAVGAVLVVTGRYSRDVLTWVVYEGREVFASTEIEVYFEMPSVVGAPPPIRTCSARWAWAGTRYLQIEQLRPRQECVPPEDEYEED